MRDEDLSNDLYNILLNINGPQFSTFSSNNWNNSDAICLGCGCSVNQNLLRITSGSSVLRGVRLNVD